MDEVTDEGIDLSAGATALGASEEGENKNLLDALSAQREETAAIRECFVPIPGYSRSGMTLLAQYHLIEGDELAAIGKKVSREYRKTQTYERNLYASIDTMIEACIGLWVDRNGEKIQLKNGPNLITGYTTDAAEALKVSGESARLCLLGLFNSNVVAIQQHSTMLGRWMGDTSIDTMAEFFDEGNP